MRADMSSTFKMKMEAYSPTMNTFVSTRFIRFVRHIRLNLYHLSSHPDITKNQLCESLKMSIIGNIFIVSAINKNIIAEALVAHRISIDVGETIIQVRSHI